MRLSIVCVLNYLLTKLIELQTPSQTISLIRHPIFLLFIIIARVKKCLNWKN